MKCERLQQLQAIKQRLAEQQREIVQAQSEPDEPFAFDDMDDDVDELSKKINAELEIKLGCDNDSTNMSDSKIALRQVQRENEKAIAEHRKDCELCQLEVNR